MHTPDTTPYVDLTIYDASPQALFERARDYVLTKMPDWDPKETNTEVVLMEALSLIVIESVFAINRLPDTMAEILFKLFGVTRDTGTLPTFSADVTVISHSTTLTVPAGYEIVYDLGDGGDIAVFTLDSALTFIAGDNVQTGTFTGNIRTDRYNNVPTGTQFTVLSPLYYVSSVVTTTPITGGSSPESDDEYFQRSIKRFNRLSDSLVLPRHMTNYALEKTYVQTATTVDLYDSTGATSGAAGTHYGHAAVFAFGDNEFLTTAQKSELQTEITDRCLASVTVTVNDPDDMSVVGVHGTVVRQDNVPQTSVAANLRMTLDDLFHPSYWTWDKYIRYTNLVSAIENVTGVDYIKDTGSGIDLEVTLNTLDWYRYHSSSSANTVGTTSLWQATAHCTVAYAADQSYTDVGGSLLITASSSSNLTASSLATSALSTAGHVVTAGDDYWLSCYVYVPAGQASKSAKMGVTWYNSSNSSLSSEETNAIATIANDWIILSERVTAPTGAVKAIIYVTVTAPASSETYYCDAFTLSKFQPKHGDILLPGEAPLVDLGEMIIEVDTP